jgi:hypothetical protein
MVVWLLTGGRGFEAACGSGAVHPGAGRLARHVGFVNWTPMVLTLALTVSSRLDIVQTSKPIAPNHCDPMSGTGLKR